MTKDDTARMAREAGYQHPDACGTCEDFAYFDLERFTALVSEQERRRGFNQGYKQAIKDCVALLMIQHEAAKGSHNYWHVAANLIEAEYGVQHDD